MNLKKSDKIVAVIGVAILIVAIIIVAFYVSEPDEVDDKDTDKDVYVVTWVEKNDGKEIKENYVGKNEPLTDGFKLTAPEQGSVITHVSVRVAWEDGNTWGLIAKGQDKLTVTINNACGGSQTHEGTDGEGNETLPFTLADRPSDEVIKDAKDLNEATQRVLDQYMDMYSAEFTYDATVVVGEGFKILQPIRSLLNVMKDKGEYFDLYISYTYYYPEITVENDDGNDDGNPTNAEEGSDGNTMAYSHLLNIGRH